MSKLKLPRLLAGGIECLVSPWDHPQSRWHDIYENKLYIYMYIYVVPPQSWGDRSDTKHSKCLLLGGRRLNQLTLIPKPKGSGGARAAMAQVGPANNKNDTKRCLPVEASLRPGEAVPWQTTECPAVPNTSVQSCR